MKKVKIYHYEPVYSFYLGCEDVEDQRPDIGFPAHSTDICPPIIHEKGLIPVFDGAGWAVVPDKFWRPRISEINYDSGRSYKSYTPLSLSELNSLHVRYPVMSMLCNTGLVSFSICQRALLINKKFELILGLHAKMHVPDQGCSEEFLRTLGTDLNPSLLYEYKLEAEAIVFLMKKVMDNLVQLSYILTSSNEFEKTKVIKYNEIGRLLDVGFGKTETGRIIMGGENYQKDDTNFLYVLNDLFNSIKHSLMHDESYSLMNPVMPPVTSYQAKRNDHKNDIIYHNHNAYHLVMGFQDNVIRILKNQKRFNAEHSGEKL